MLLCVLEVLDTICLVKLRRWSVAGRNTPSIRTNFKQQIEMIVEGESNVRKIRLYLDIHLYLANILFDPRTMEQNLFLNLKRFNPQLRQFPSKFKNCLNNNSAINYISKCNIIDS